MQSFIAYLHELPDEIRNEMFMRRFLGRMDSRMEMRGHGLDMSQWASRSSTPEEITIQKNPDSGTQACDELYWWLHYYKLQNLYRYLKGEKVSDFRIWLYFRLLAKSSICPIRRRFWQGAPKQYCRPWSFSYSKSTQASRLDTVCRSVSSVKPFINHYHFWVLCGLSLEMTTFGQCVVT